MSHWHHEEDGENRNNNNKQENRMNQYFRSMASKASSTWASASWNNHNKRPSAEDGDHDDYDRQQQQRVSLLSPPPSALHAGRMAGSFDRDDSLLLEDELDDNGGLGASLLPPTQSIPRGGARTLRAGSFEFRTPLWHPDNRRTALRLLRQLGDYLAYLTLLTMLALIPLVLYRALSNRKVDLAAWNSAGVMACGTVVLSFRQVYLHLTHWYMPEVQKYVVRILWMVPIYSIQSWLSLRYHHSRIYIDPFRDLYEAYVIASFVYYLIALLGGQDALVQILLHKRNDPSTTLGQHPFPLRLILQRWELGMEFLLQCKHGVLQYVVFKIAATLLIYFFEMTGLYCEGTFSWKVAYPYMCFFQNISVMYALYSLVMLYSAVKDELEYPVNWKPLYKFLCIKGVVFFTWWQGVIIFYLRAHGIIGNVGDWSSKDVAYGLIDYCIVIEMVGFAIAHSYTFTYKEYLPGGLPTAVPLAVDDNDDNNNNNDDDTMLLRCHDRPQRLPTATALDGSMDRDGNDEGDAAWSHALDSRPSHPAAVGGTQHSHHSRSSVGYRPPATLEHPMKFRDALWSSTLPRETIEDIQRLRRAGFDTGSVLQDSVRRRSAGDDDRSADVREISLPEIDGNDLRLTTEDANEDVENGDIGDCAVATVAAMDVEPLEAERETIEPDNAGTEWSADDDTDRLARM